jgi:ABC-2 type transport system permease protein
MPGLVMMSIITNSYTNVVSSFYGAKYSRHIEEMQIAPVPNLVILLGFVSGGMARGICVGAAVTLVSLLFTEFHVHNLLVILLVALLTSCLFSMAGLINAIFANSFDDITIIPTFVLTPLTYLGGIFYSIKLLPEFWQTVSLGNPILYMVNSFRYGFRGSSDIDLFTALLVILFFIALLFSVCLTLLSRGTGIRQ